MNERMMQLTPKRDHPGIEGIYRNVQNVEMTLDGMTNGDKLLVLSLIGRRIGSEMIEKMEEITKETTATGETVALVHSICLHVEGFQAATTMMDFTANPERYNADEVEEG